MDTFSVLVAFCEGKPPVTIGLSSQRPVAWSFDVFFDLRLKETKTLQQTIEATVI